MNETPRINIQDAPWMECSDNNMMFETKLLFKRISPLLSPTGKEEYVPLEAIVCTKCGKVPRFFYEKAKDIPLELQSPCTFKSK